MHELGITQELIDQVCEEAKKNQIDKISRVQVSLGRDSHITEGSLRFCFQVLSEGTIVRCAKLEIRPTPGSFLSLNSFEGK